MDYIDDLYRKMLASQGRYPASAQSEVPVQKEPINYIQSEAPGAIEYPAGYKVQVPQSEIIRENVNEALKSQMQEKQALAANAKDIFSEREGYKKDMSDALERMKALSDSSYQSPELDAQIKMYQQKMSEPREEVPPRDAISELILNLGPALGAKFMGEAGALSAPGAMKGARDIYENQRKEEVDRVKNLKDNTEKKLKALIDLKKSGQESFDKSAERGLGRIKAELEATRSMATMSNDDLKRTEDNLLKINESISKETGSKAVEIAKMEREKQSEKEKGENLPLDKKKMVERYATEVARINGIKSQVDELYNQTSDLSIPERDRRATAQEQLKLLNSTLGADAVGAEESKRMSAFLDPMPNWIKPTMGVDMEGFNRQLERTKKRLSGTISSQQKEVDKIYGRPVKEEPKKVEAKAEDVIQKAGRTFRKKPNGKYEEVQ